MKAIYSFWNPEGDSNKCGFNSLRDLVASTALSVELLKERIGRVELVTNSFGEDLLINQGQIPFSSVSVSLNQFDSLIPKYFWALPKLYACSIQNEPFIHIDNDVYLWNGIKRSLLEAPIAFQNKEDYTNEPKYYGWYPILKNEFETLPFTPQVIKNNTSPHAWNCGVIAINDLALMQEWYELSSCFILNQSNQDIILKSNNLIHVNLYYEQFFIGCLIRSKGRAFEEKVQTWFRKFDECNNYPRYTHLWGTDKRRFIDRVYRRLYEIAPQYEAILNQILV